MSNSAHRGPPKPLKGKPATFSQKSVTAKANAARQGRRPGAVFLFIILLVSMEERLHYAK